MCKASGHKLQEVMQTVGLDAFVDQDAHLGTREQEVLCFLESGNNSFTRYGWGLAFHGTQEFRQEYRGL